MNFWNIVDFWNWYVEEDKNWYVEEDKNDKDGVDNKSQTPPARYRRTRSFPRPIPMMTMTTTMWTHIVRMIMMMTMMIIMMMLMSPARYRRPLLLAPSPDPSWFPIRETLLSEKKKHTLGIGGYYKVNMTIMIILCSVSNLLACLCLCHNILLLSVFCGFWIPRNVIYLSHLLYIIFF